MPRFFITGKYIVSPGSITITGEDVNHIKNVLRCKKGEILVLCDGNGIDFRVCIDSIEKGQVVTKILDASRNTREPPLETTLFQGIPKSDKMEYVIQKAVELGVKRIVPVITERTVFKANRNESLEKKKARWQRISLEAAKQCDRGIIPEIEEPVIFKEILKHFGGFEFVLVPYEEERQRTIKSFIEDINIKAAETGRINIKSFEGTESEGTERASIKRAGILIGPEGGFSEEEAGLAAKAGGVLVTLGPRILRTETAGLAVLAILMYELGDMG